MWPTPSAYAGAVYLALTIFAIGLAWKVSTWFLQTVGVDGRGVSPQGRLGAALKGIGSVLLSPKIFTLAKVFLLDVVLQVRLLRRNFYRWLMHMLIYGGFMMLLLMHALSPFTMSRLFPEYQPTLNPFLFLRDFFGVLVILGATMAIVRRISQRRIRLKTAPMDVYAIGILVLILVSGFLLEGVKTLSRSAFTEMVEEYAINPDPEEVYALEGYWVKEFGLAPSAERMPSDAKFLEEGKALHEMSCAQCHSRPQWGFTGYAASRLLKPLAQPLESARAPVLLWYVHVLAFLIGLAYLPFSKMFHILAGPVSLLANSVMARDRSHPANLATRQRMELDACTHCGACTLACSVGVVVEAIPNVTILPSEKIAPLKRLAAGKPLTEAQVATIRQGLYLCTNCNRCTEACPVGINLWELWFSAREALLEKTGQEVLLLSPLALHRALVQYSPEPLHGSLTPNLAHEVVTAAWDLEKVRDQSRPLDFGERDILRQLGASSWSESFSGCYNCMTCSSSCPVVRNYSPNPREVLGLLPHQIMHAIGFRLWDHVFTARMLWDCLGCYQCQEHCPQNVRVADVLYKLKNLAIARAVRRPPDKD